MEANSKLVERLASEGYDAATVQRLIQIIHQQSPTLNARSALVHGPRGCGKTSLVNRILSASRDIRVVHIPAHVRPEQHIMS